MCKFSTIWKIIRALSKKKTFYFDIWSKHQASQMKHIFRLDLASGPLFSKHFSIGEEKASQSGESSGDARGQRGHKEQTPWGQDHVTHV